MSDAHREAGDGAAAGGAGSLRPPETVMRLARLGAAHPNRLSVSRRLIRRLHGESARVSRPVWTMDAAGHGRAVYTVSLGGAPYSLVAFSDPLDPASRTDRVIAERWDTTYALYDGAPDAGEIDRLAANAPLQEAGRFSPRELILTRANKSVRLFEHVAGRLAEGRQPDRSTVRSVGYLMRTTAVYGNGKFGIADRAAIAERPGLEGAFQAEMLAVWLVRGFTHDLVEHVARARGGARAATLDPAIKRHLGIGNATGLGMAPFLVRHPTLLDQWIRTRETALARVCAELRATPETIARFLAVLARARRHVAEWTTDDPVQAARLATLRAEMAELAAFATPERLAGPAPWDQLIRAATAWSTEAEELTVALVLEPHGALIDAPEAPPEDPPDAPPAPSRPADRPRLAPGMRAGALLRLIEARYAWALAIDFASPDAARYFWYVSEEKSEPRLGDRRVDPEAPHETPLDVARQIQALVEALRAADARETVAALLLRRPDLRHVVRRAQTAAEAPYAEIQDNLIGDGLRPIDLLRAKLAQFGAAKFDPKSDRWTRITLFQGAPSFDAIGDADADDWAWPALDG